MHNSNKDHKVCIVCIVVRGYKSYEIYEYNSTGVSSTLQEKRLTKTMSPIQQDDLFLDLPRFKEVSEIPCAHDHPTNNPIHGKRPTCKCAGIMRRKFHFATSLTHALERLQGWQGCGRNATAHGGRFKLKDPLKMVNLSRKPGWSSQCPIDWTKWPVRLRKHSSPELLDPSPPAAACSGQRRYTM